MCGWGLVVWASVCALCGLATAAQLSGQAAASDTSSAVVSVYLDCQGQAGFSCDQDFFRTEIVFVNWVFDRAAADVHLLVTAQQAGGGGRQYTLAFLGLRRFVGDDQQLAYSASGDANQDDIRRALSDQFKLGLVRYAVRSSARDRLRVMYAAPAGAAPSGQVVSDPWNAWAFTVGMNGFANVESSTSRLNLNGTVDADRVTEGWKLNIGANYNRNRSRFQLTDREVIAILTNWGVTGLAVKTVTTHWSAGTRLSGESISTENQDLYLTAAPGVEFNVFPYSESTRRSLTFQYLLTVNHFEWADTTIFGEIEETRLGHSATASIQMNQPWGNIRLNLSGNQYFHDLSKCGVQVGGNMRWRIFRGFSLRFGGNYGWVRDQALHREGGPHRR